MVKGEKVKPVFEEPPNPTNVEVSLQQMKANDPSLQEVNLNNIKVFDYDCCQSLALFVQSGNLQEMTTCLYTCSKSFIVADFEAKYPIQKEWIYLLNARHPDGRSLGENAYMYILLSPFTTTQLSQYC